MKKSRRLIASAAFALAATGAAVVGTVVTAPAASAAVAPGNYTFITTDFGVPTSLPASVQNGVLTIYPIVRPLGPLTYQIIDLPGGGFFDNGQGQRWYLGGENFWGPFIIGHNTLIPR